MHGTDFPTRLFPLNKFVTINTHRPLGVTAEIFLHETARKMAKYNTPIQCDAYGIDKQGARIEVNTLGRWLFGVPGFQSHVRVVPQGDNVIIYYPDQAPQVVETFLHELKNSIEHRDNDR